ncbi:MAG: hypothetical protein WCS15_00210 [Prevotella sp.]|nr:hypothetical protein [Massilibacteroides sp.]
MKNGKVTPYELVMIGAKAGALGPSGMGMEFYVAKDDRYGGDVYADVTTKHILEEKKDEVLVLIHLDERLTFETMTYLIVDTLKNRNLL